MRIGGMARDGMMTVIPVCVAVFVAMIILGGPEEGLRAMERLAYDLWSRAAVLLRH
jgi:hypothetical protein